MGFSKKAVNQVIPGLVSFSIGTEADVRRACASIDRLPEAEDIPIHVIARTLRVAALSNEQISMIIGQLFLFVVVRQLKTCMHKNCNVYCMKRCYFVADAE